MKSQRLASPFARKGTIAAVSTAALCAALVWPGVVKHLFDFKYMPHGTDLLWSAPLLSLHLVSDLLIGAAYLSICAGLVYLVCRARRNVVFHWIMPALGAFIVAGGASHFLAAWTIWHATYWLSGAVKMVTAMASVATGAVLPLIVPRIVEVFDEARLWRDRE